MTDDGLSIVIVSYNNPEVLRDCLDSVYAMNDLGEDLQVIVVEQSPGEEIYRFVLEHYPAVDAVRAENRGFGAGNNRGAEIAKHDYLLFLNPDTLLTEPIGVFAVKKFAENPKLGLFGVQLLDADGREAGGYQCIIPYGLRAKIRYHAARRSGGFSQEHMYIEGADMFVRKTAFERAGRFDEAVFMYGEEMDLCLRIRKLGYETAFDGSRRIVHLQGACSPDRYGAVYGRQMDSFEYMCGKHGLPYNKILKAEYFSQQIKMLLLFCMGRRGSSAYKTAKEKCEVLKTRLHRKTER